MLADVLEDNFVGPAPAPDRRPAPQRAARIEVDSDIAIPMLPHSLEDSTRWRSIVKGGWRWSGPIHVLEARIMLCGLIRISRVAGVHGRRTPSLGDNLSFILGFV